MPENLRTTVVRGLALLGLFAVAASLLTSSSPEAALLADRPQPIERSLNLISGDFDRDGFEDIVVANFQAGTLQVLINQAGRCDTAVTLECVRGPLAGTPCTHDRDCSDGTFAPHPESPIGVGIATFSYPTTGPLFMATAELNPEDADGDGVENADDNCPNVFNEPDLLTGEQSDELVPDGAGDACVDRDGDGEIDPISDSDADGVPDYDSATDALDNCPLIPNPGQEDNGAPGIDGICGTADDIPFLYGADRACGGGDDLGADDGVGDACAASPDLVIIGRNSSPGSIFGVAMVRLNDGGGGTDSRSSRFTGVLPAQVLLEDFDGDGRPDMVVSSTGSDLLQLLPGEADGVFGSQQLLDTGDEPHGLAAADFDGDGALDLAVANRADHTVDVFINSGTGLPGSATSSLATATQPTVPLAGHLDGDAYADLVVLAHDRLVCVGGPQDGNSCSNDTDCADPADPSNDGTCESDGSGVGMIQAFTGSDSGTLTPNAAASKTLAPGQRPTNGVLEDLDGDSDLDLAVTVYPEDTSIPGTSGEVLIYRGAGDGTLTLATTLSGLSAPFAIATIDFDPLDVDGPDRDLAVQDFDTNRTVLYRNDGSLNFNIAPTSPASPWRDTSAVALLGADPLVSVDMALLQRAAARIDILSGLGTQFFRALPVLPLEGTATATSLEVNDLRDDARPDIAVLNATAGTVTVLTNDPGGTFLERETLPVPAPVSAASGPLIKDPTDYDRDGVANVLDNCPTRYNPPLCKVTDAECANTVLCDDTSQVPIDCGYVDPTTSQCDSDGNGIGDHCQQLTSECTFMDSDSDLVPDYSPTALVLLSAPGVLDFDRDTVSNSSDNCPTTANLDQADADLDGVGDACQVLPPDCPGSAVDTDSPPDGFDDVCDTDLDGIFDYDPVTLALDNCPSIPNSGQEDNDADGVGNICNIDAALDNCPFRQNSDQSDVDPDADGVGDLCDTAVQDLVTVSPASGSLTLLLGDGSGHLHEAATSPIAGLTNPTAAGIGSFSLLCTGPTLTFCVSRATNDVVVTETVVPGNTTDDLLTLYEGDGVGGFTPTPPAAAEGDPSGLLIAVNQPVCPVAGDPSEPSLRFDTDGLSSVIATIQPGSASLGIYLPSNMNYLDAGRSPLVHPYLPPASLPLPASLPVPAPLTAAEFADMNQDGILDLVALSSGDGVPATPNLTIFIGIGNGLFFTDPTLNPSLVPDGSVLMAISNVDLKTDSFLPDVVLFDQNGYAPTVLLNVMKTRADIDRSGRVDGFDLALLTRAFGATRGEDFTLQPDGTLLQSGSGYDRVLVGTGAAVPGQDLPGATGSCNGILDAMTGAYGLPVDINLDGVVDGEDLAIMASLFGSEL